jgi:hypothetical protein
MTQQPLFILRQSPDWHSLAADFKQGNKIDPARFRPPVPVPGFPGNIVQLVAQWNETMGVDFFSCRSRLKEMCEDSIAKIPGAKRVSYLDLESIGPEITNYVAFFHDDDDWFAPDMARILEDVLPDDYDICVFPLVRIATLTSTVIRQGGRPDVLVGVPRPFSHRYQSNNYGINGRICNNETLLNMKDHVLGSEFANTKGLRDTYVNRVLSATVKTPCSAQAVAQMFRDPAKARTHVQAYVTAIKALEIPGNLPWIAERLKNVIELFSEALGTPAPRPTLLGRLMGRPAVQPVAAAMPAAVAQPAAAVKPAAAVRPAAVARAAKAPASPARPRPPTPNPTGAVELPPALHLQRHSGVQYIQFLKFLAERQAPSSYLEVGTRNGESVAQVDCDAICVDPNFALTFNVAKKRGRTLLFQETSDDFFAKHDVRQIFPQGLDLSFLDGLHLFEFLLRDFINTEKFCHEKSVILMHDCLPFKKEITNRVQTPGAWTGDVWKVLAILKKYRPDVNVIFFDCPPTGLVACTNLDPNSTVLADSYDQIVAEFADAALPDDLLAMYPRIDTNVLVAAPEKLSQVLASPAAGVHA